MIIQWFPGHMTKALREMKAQAAVVDGFLYLLDARCPRACINPEFDHLISQKPSLYVLNKADLADAEVSEDWLDFFRFNKRNAIACISTENRTKAVLLRESEKLLSEKIRRLKEKGIRKPLRLMVVGVPNCGKSTLINCLCGQKRAQTGDRPGVTKGKQWVRLSEGVELMDTPGTLWPSFEDQVAARHLAYIGSIREEILDVTELAEELIEELRGTYPHYFSERFPSVETNAIRGNILEDICRKRGWLVKGGQADIERGAKTILEEFRKGKIGKISLERP